MVIYWSQRFNAIFDFEKFSFFLIFSVLVSLSVWKKNFFLDVLLIKFIRKMLWLELVR